jgi:hypothetical protein
MADQLPEGEQLRRAVKWIASSLQDNPDQPVFRLVDQAVFKFDLSPKDAEFLLNMYKPGAAK